MPILELSPEPKDNVYYLSSVMAAPEDEERRLQFYASLAVKQKLVDTPQEKIEVTIDRSVLEAILSAKSLDDIDIWAAPIKLSGSLAGDVLRFTSMLQLAERDASVRKAIHLTQQYHQSSETVDGRPVPTSEPKIRAAWEEFKPVAHMWAAFRVFQDLFRDERDEGAEVINEDNWINFLRCSEWYREFGENFVASRQKEGLPLLPPERTWKLPEGSVEPLDNPPFAGLPDWADRALESYRRDSGR